MKWCCRRVLKEIEQRKAPQTRTLVLLVGSLLTSAVQTAAQDIVTYHNDNQRTGQNLAETLLTPADVRVNTFGKLFNIPVDGKVDAQPLYISGVPIPGIGSRNLIVIATEHGTVYVSDGDTGRNIWNRSTLKTGETTSDPRGCAQIVPEIGITATPVIDRFRGPNGVIYVTAMSKDASGNYHQRLHALDLSTGAELLGGPVDIQAVFPGTGDNAVGGNVIFDPGQYKERTALLLLNGMIYT